MESSLTVSDAARRISETTQSEVRPRDISTLFYERIVRDDLCPIIGGRRLIPESYLGVIESALRRRGCLPKSRTANA